MKALILAGGAGTRLRPITHTSAKQLVPVANKPVLDYGLEAMAAAGITEVGIIVGATRAEIEAHVGDGSAWGLDVTFVHQPEPLGLAHAVLTAEDFLGEDDFVMYLGDNLLAGGIGEFVAGFERARPTAQILLAQVPNPQEFGVAALDDAGRVTRLVEKPADPPSDLALVGVYLFTSRIFEAAKSIAPSGRGELEITDALQWLIDAGEPVDSHVVSGWWKDTGKLDDLLEANRIVLDATERRVDGSVDDASLAQGKVVLEAGAQLVNSTVRGPTVIGAGARIVDSYVGPYSAIDAGCVVTRSEVEHAIILADSTVTDVQRLEDSLIGRESTVAYQPTRPRAYRLMIGDHSSVGLA
ncbi:glucose-1-phosphate thymidylyltransferase [Egibacter rhizosphaerae]|uniref:Glucose-1-phosphate thymidylyltransferase n=1 Tax=Egibacter rhizosphaerae TaxID=1670831 RepID=A0A411YGK3_9ACTN|nr:glucose-1-phosphate thymidylyltransferase [Egibacter rhizosphaerae]QBI20306.1 glucose-1-phosphate thymidylyltransferase [Egibacter rhizosphaerae]